MKHYWLRLHPLQPLQLPDPALIAGRTLRGAVAAVLLERCRPEALHEDGPCGPNCQFWPVFGARNAVRFRNAYAAQADDTFPPLASAYTCSQVPGLRSAGKHGVADSAIRQWVFEELTSQGGRSVIPNELRCPVCGADWVPFESPLSQLAERRYEGVSSALSTVTTTEHRPFDRALRRPLPAFTQEGVTIIRSAYYVAPLSLPDTLDGLFRNALAGGLRIGGRRTRGMGAVRAELVPRPDPAPTLHERIAAFNRAIGSERRFYAAMGDELPVSEGGWYFTLDFPEGIIGDFARQPDFLQGVNALRNVKVIRQWLRPALSGGWHQAAGMPTRTQLAVAGVVLCAAPPDADRSGLEQSLAYLESYGLGAERDRGFGAITVCHPFHLEMEPL